MRDWPLVPLKELFDIARGGSPRPISKYITEDPNGINWIMIGDASESSKYIVNVKKRIKKEGVSKSRMVYPGDFLLTNSMSFGRPYLLKTSGCIHDGWLVLRDQNGKIDHDFFYHLLGSKAVYLEFQRKAAGAVVKNLNIDLVKSVEIPLPPLPEQKRIAAILDKADALREKRRQAMAKLDELLQSVFLDMFGDPVMNPKGWEDDTKLGEVAEIVSGITKGRKLNGKKTREIPYMAVVNVQDRRLNLETIKKIQATEDEINKYRLSRNDLLLTEGGDPDKLGRGSLWNNELPESIHQNHIFRVRITTEKLNPVYLNWIIGSVRGKRYFLKSAKQTTGIASINMTQLKNFPLLIPPIGKQNQFAHQVAVIEKNVKTLHSNLEQLNLLFSSLQQRAFKGEL